MWVDTHAHLDMKGLNERLDEVLDNARQAGIERIITIGIDLETSRRAIELADRHEMVYASAGVHPHDAAKAKDSDFDALLGLLAHPKCVALGETGLDYHYDFSPRDVQKAVFTTQLRLARALNKPLIIHVREAMEDALDIIDSVNGGQWSGVFHCFGGDEDDVPEVIKRGFHIAFTGVVSFKNFKKAEAVRRVPISRLLVETDAPYMAPVPHRGKTCEPAHVALTGEAMARIRGTETQELARQTTKNAFGLFKLGMI